VPWCECAAAECEPRCVGIGEATEGWVHGCTGALLVEGACAACQPVCRFIGTRSEGWYSSCAEGMAEGLIAFDFCGPRRTCGGAPEAQCADLACTVGQAATHECKDGSEVPFCACDVPAAACPPVCRATGGADEGWYDSCSGALVKSVKCAGCEVRCDAVGSRSEGWYSSCDDLIAWAFCATGTWRCAGEPWLGCSGVASE
jgi:hypothetical protein